MLLRVLAVAPTLRRASRLAALCPKDRASVRQLGARGSLWEAVRAEPFDLLVIDEESIAGSAGTFIGDLRATPEAPEVIVITEGSTPGHRAELQAARASGVVDRAAPAEEVASAMQGLFTRIIELRHRHLASELSTAPGLLTDFATASPAMRRFLTFVRKVVASDSTLLVQGETGVGKEFLSRAIHAGSPRSSGPFVPVNCSALSETLLESELFGHVEGAFTGATRGRKGYFEMAHQGTLFLDEVGELRPQTQVKLLRVLQERRVQPVGSEQEIEVDVRLIAATNRVLSDEVEAGRFRADLFYRLSVVELAVPPLRRRKEDIPGLFESHVEDFGISMRRPAREVRADALDLLSAYPWPGNVRELINVAERAALLCEGTTVTPLDLPEEIRRGGAEHLAEASDATPPDRSGEDREDDLLLQPYQSAKQHVVDAFEHSYLEALLTRCRGRIDEAAAESGIHTRTLYEKLKRHGLRKERFRRRGGTSPTADGTR